MELFKSIPFTHRNENFDIRIFYNDTLINVIAFLGGYPANGFRYQVKTPKGCDTKSVLEKSPVPNLVDKCKNDIETQNWDKLSTIIQDTSSDVTNL